MLILKRNKTEHNKVLMRTLIKREGRMILSVMAAENYSKGEGDLFS